jgi:NAD(P)H dehydrogenase (quinone)
VSAQAFTDRQTQETNAIRAAQAAGIERIVYTSIQKKNGSTEKIPMVTEISDISEEAILKSGMQCTILRNSLYIEALVSNIGGSYLSTGKICTPGGYTKAALAYSVDPG